MQKMWERIKEKWNKERKKKRGKKGKKDLEEQLENGFSIYVRYGSSSSTRKP
jgi:hypothetical protein